jgi:hypothetical protein
MCNGVKLVTSQNQNLFSFHFREYKTERPLPFNVSIEATMLTLLYSEFLYTFSLFHIFRPSLLIFYSPSTEVEM